MNIVSWEPERHYKHCSTIFPWEPEGHYHHRLCTAILSYSDKRKQLFKMTFLVNERNVSVMYIDINAISLYLDLNIFQQDECFCSKLWMEIEYAKSNLKTSLFQIWVIWQLLPFVRIGQNRPLLLLNRTSLHGINILLALNWWYAHYAGNRPVY